LISRGAQAGPDIHVKLKKKIIFNDRRFGQEISADPIFVSKTAKDLAP
jgi:hypothetical protein